MVKHYSQAIRPDGGLWRIMYELRWVPRLILAGVCLWISTMAFDRDPPFKLLSYWTNQPTPGGMLVVRAKVHRELDRECSVTFSRYLFDRFGTRHEATGPQMMSPQALREMNASAPGELNLLVPIPTYFPPGQARLSTILEYRCNALQDVLRPINVEMNIWFEVLK